jgi:hypothetical protein
MYANSGVAFEHGDLDLDFRDLSIEILRHERLNETFHAMYLGFKAASGLVSGQSSSQRPAQES